MTPDSLRLPDTGSTTPWTALDRWPQRPRDFSFVLLSDRTGLPKPSVFERAITAIKLLRPDFAIHIGDSNKIGFLTHSQ